MSKVLPNPEDSAKESLLWGAILTVVAPCAGLFWAGPLIAQQLGPYPPSARTLIGTMP